MPGLFLYSAMPFMKYYIYTNYLHDVHYVWCSEVYDHQCSVRPSPKIASPPSSNPAEIYAQLHQASSRSDKGDLRIQQWRAGLLSYVPNWQASALIDAAQAGEIAYLLNAGDFELWRPLLYIIDRAAVGTTRTQLVDPAKRAGPAPEYIIDDLGGNEFDVMEIRRA
jgi:hypothetical protein